MVTKIIIVGFDLLILFISFQEEEVNKILEGKKVWKEPCI
jgi:hypothetical protein